MPVLSSAEAVAQAQRLLDLPPSDTGSVWHVRRLDQSGAYLLVHVAGHVACLDDATGELLASATTTRSPVAIPREMALERAALGGAPTVELVWEPCAATMSMFDPLWSIEFGSQRVFVDQRAKVWLALLTKEPGGARC